LASAAEDRNPPSLQPSFQSRPRDFTDVAEHECLANVSLRKIGCLAMASSSDLQRSRRTSPIKLSGGSRALGSLARSKSAQGLDLSARGAPLRPLQCHQHLIDLVK
jgi:hypothetical protein